MKTLPEVLREAIALLDTSRARVIIERGNLEPLDARSEAFQICLQKFRYWSEPEYKSEARSWLGEQWGPWRPYDGWLGGAGFDLRDVLATDWRILP